MSKKSRRRNKKILAVLGALGGAALMARNKRNASIEANEAKESGFDIPPVTSTPKKKPVISTPVSTKTTIMDSMPARPKLNEKSIRVKDGKVFTIEGAKKGIPSKRSGIETPGIYVNEKGNITAGGKQFYDKNQYRTRNDKPGMLGDSGFSLKPSMQSMSGLADGDFAAKDGGRAKLKSGGKVKGCGKALRGFGRAMKGRK